MSAGQVQRLQGLLARVQQNRQQGREPSELAATSQTHAQLEALPAPPVLAPKPIQPVAAAQPVVSIKPVPVVAPIAAPAAAKPMAQPVAKAAVPEVAVARAVPVASPVAAPSPNAPARVVTSPAPPSAPIAQASSPHPSMDGPSFGELLRRSLALRPR